MLSMQLNIALRSRQIFSGHAFTSGREQGCTPILHVCLVALLAIAMPALAVCPVDPPPPEDCDNNGDFVGGRWDISERLGNYTLDGTEIFYWPDPVPDENLVEDYITTGTLNVEIVGGVDENFIDVACDGTVSGQGRERISGTIDKAFAPALSCSALLSDDMDMHWNVVIERSYTITGVVSGHGQLDLDLTVDTAILDASGQLYAQLDGFCQTQPQSIEALDIAGDIERIRLSGGYDPDNGLYEPQISTLDARTWLDDIFHRLALNFEWPWIGAPFVMNPVLEPAGSTQPPFQTDNEYFIQDAVSVTEDLQIKSDSTAPIIVSLVLQEPAQYLLEVPVDSEVVATIDWRGEPPGTVEFTYGGTTDIVPGADSVSWTFNAGEPGIKIDVVAIGSEAESAPFSVAVPKVSVPGWAGSAGDWSGAAGIQYDAVLDWPVTLETTRTLNTISLFSGLWGISGSISSDFNATAYSNGSPGTNQMTTDASFRFAGKSMDFQLAGPNQTTLTCDDLTTQGSATIIIPLLKWKKTINPLTLIPGVEPAVCSLSGLLCSVIKSIGIKAEANANLAGTPSYIGQDAEIEWDGGSLGGSLDGSIGLAAGLPKPLNKVASFSVYGGAGGCIDFTVAPDLALTTLGGELNAGISASFFGLTAGADEQWPFGDPCPFATVIGRGDPIGWVPADGQLSMAAQMHGAGIQGIAVWSELPGGQSRPSGNIHYRFFNGDQWGPIHALTDSVQSDIAPAVEFDGLGNAVIVYMHSPATVPSQTSDLPAFADSLELHWASVDPVSELPVATGSLTANTVNDFGPDLQRDADGGLHLFWQQASGIEITGTAGDPVAILSSSWNPAGASWAESQTVAAGLVSTFGWSAAALSDQTMLVGLIIDTDDDLETDADRELFRILKSDGIWASPVQVTTNNIVDDSVQTGFDSQGNPVLVWRSGQGVFELRGELQDLPALAFTTPDPARDDGVGQQFSEAALAARESGFAVIWPDGIELLSTVVTEGGEPWTVPVPTFGSGEVEMISLLRWIDDRRVVGYATRTFESDGFTPQTTILPQFLIEGDGRIFSDRFQSFTAMR